MLELKHAGAGLASSQKARARIFVRYPAIGARWMIVGHRRERWEEDPLGQFAVAGEKIERSGGLDYKSPKNRIGRIIGTGLELTLDPSLNIIGAGINVHLTIRALKVSDDIASFSLACCSAHCGLCLA